MDTPTDPRPLLERATAQFAALVADTAPGQLEDPTPCTEFDVRALISHTLGNTRVYTRFADGGAVTEETGSTADVPDDGWADACAAAGERLVAASRALSEEALERKVDLGFATMSMRDALGAIVMELAAHTWDLREALGRPAELAPEPAEFALSYAHRTLPPERRGAPVPFEPVRPAPEDADAYGKLAAWLGRTVSSPHI